MRMAAARGTEGPVRAVRAHHSAIHAELGDEFPGPVEYNDAVIAITVGDVDVAGLPGEGPDLGIHCDVGRLVEERVAGVKAVSLVACGKDDGRRGGRRAVTHALHADLQRVNPTTSVGRVFLDDAVTIAGDPDVPFKVHVAAVGTVRQVGGSTVVGVGGRDESRVAPGSDHVA